MKKVLILILALLMLFTSAAWAAPGDVVLYMDLNNGFEQNRRLQAMTVMGDTIYGACEDYSTDVIYCSPNLILNPLNVKTR